VVTLSERASHVQRRDGADASMYQASRRGLFVLKDQGGTMRFTDVRHVEASADEVWSALHDSEVLRAAIPGCERLSPVGTGRYSATLAARVGRLADTYRGTFAIDDTTPGSELVVSIAGRGRCGTLELDLCVRLDPGFESGTTALAYDARARVGGLVARLGRAPLTIAGGHITGCFFRDLERALRARSRAGLASAR
jgi:carbon monoxide dehydrogenase subunit G